jgi:hypothetical protein
MAPMCDLGFSLMNMLDKIFYRSNLYRHIVLATVLAAMVAGMYFFK